MNKVCGIIFLVAYQIVSGSSAKLELIVDSNSILVDAITTIIGDVAAERSQGICICLASSDSMVKQELEDILNQILSLNHHNTFLIQNQLFVELNEQSTSKYLNIFLVDNYESFRKIFTAMGSPKIDYEEKFLIVFTSLEDEHQDLEYIFSDLWSIFIVHVDIILYSSNLNEVLVYTFFPFSKQYCNEVHPVLWKRLIIGEFVGQRNFYPEKIKKLFDCPLNVGSFQTAPFMVINKHADGSFSFDGLDGNLLMMLAEKLNFNINLTELPENSLRWGTLYRNGSSSGAIKLILDGKADLLIGQFSQTGLRKLFMTSSMPYEFMPWGLMVPVGAPYSAFEKLLKPFEFNVWITVSIIFVLFYVAITIIKFISGTLRTIFFGPQNQNPYLSVVEIFFGVSMRIIPAKSFARGLLMIFILYTLVIRSIYQGVLIKDMQSTDLKPPIDSMDKMVQKKFFIYMTKTHSEHIQNSPIQNRSVFIQPSEHQKYRQKLDDPNFLGAMTSSLDFVLYYNELSWSKHLTMFCKEILYTHQYVIYLQKNSFLKNAVNSVIEALQTNGIMSYWRSQTMNIKYLKGPPEAKEPRKLDLDQLMGGVYLFCLGLMIGIVIFIFELISLKCSCLRNAFEWIMKSK